MPEYFTDEKNRVRKIDESHGRPNSRSMKGGHGHTEGNHEKFGLERLERRNKFSDYKSMRLLHGGSDDKPTFFGKKGVDAAFIHGFDITVSNDRDFYRNPISRLESEATQLMVDGAFDEKKFEKQHGEEVLKKAIRVFEEKYDGEFKVTNETREVIKKELMHSIVRAAREGLPMAAAVRLMAMIYNDKRKEGKRMTPNEMSNVLIKQGVPATIATDLAGDMNTTTDGYLDFSMGWYKHRH